MEESKQVRLRIDESKTIELALTVWTTKRVFDEDEHQMTSLGSGSGNVRMRYFFENIDLVRELEQDITNLLEQPKYKEFAKRDRTY